VIDSLLGPSGDKAQALSKMAEAVASKHGFMFFITFSLALDRWRFHHAAISPNT
jgi:hypothetical protein